MAFTSLIKDFTPAVAHLVKCFLSDSCCINHYQVEPAQPSHVLTQGLLPTTLPLPPTPLHNTSYFVHPDYFSGLHTNIGSGLTDN